MVLVTLPGKLEGGHYQAGERKCNEWHTHGRGTSDRCRIGVEMGVRIVHISSRVVGPSQDVRVREGRLGPVLNPLMWTPAGTVMPSKEAPLSGTGLGVPPCTERGFCFLLRSLGSLK